MVKNNYPKVNLSKTEVRRLKESLTIEQQNRCYLCGVEFGVTSFHPMDPDGSGFTSKALKFLDHNHETGAPRKLLCHVCNTQLTYYERYISIDALIEFQSKEAKKRIPELEHALQLYRENVKQLHELKAYVERGECNTPHILQQHSWGFNKRYIHAAPLVPIEELEQLNTLLLGCSQETWASVREHMAQAVRECITLLKQNTDGAGTGEKYADE